MRLILGPPPALFWEKKLFNFRHLTIYRNVFFSKVMYSCSRWLTSQWGYINCENNISTNRVEIQRVWPSCPSAQLPDLTLPDFCFVLLKNSAFHLPDFFLIFKEFARIWIENIYSYLDLNEGGIGSIIQWFLI